MTNEGLRFYELFLNNNVSCDYYRIELSNGAILKGVPTAGSLVDLQNPTFSINGLEIALCKVVTAQKTSA